MSLKQIENIHELEVERTRLRREAELAQRCFVHKLNDVYLKGKSQLRESMSLPKTAAALAGAGIQHFTQPAVDNTPVNNPFDLLDDLQVSIRDYQEKSTNKWTAFLPLVPKLIQLWQQQQMARAESSAIYRPSQAAAKSNGTTPVEPALS